MKKISFSGCSGIRFTRVVGKKHDSVVVDLKSPSPLPIQNPKCDPVNGVIHRLLCRNWSLLEIINEELRGIRTLSPPLVQTKLLPICSLQYSYSSVSPKKVCAVPISTFRELLWSLTISVPPDASELRHSPGSLSLLLDFTFQTVQRL